MQGTSTARLQILTLCGLCPACLAQNASSTALLKPEEQKEVATVVKDFLYLKSIEKELKGILKRAPTIAEWAKAVKAEDVG